MAKRPVYLRMNGIRGQLTLWFGGLTFVTLASVGIFLGQIATDKLAEINGEALYVSAKAAANQLAYGLNDREKEVHTLSFAPHLVAGELSHPDVRSSLELRKTIRGELAWFGVADRSGRVIQATGNLLVDEVVSQRPWFKAGLNRPYTGDVHEALLLAKLLPALPSNEPLRFIDFAAPIRDRQGEVRGVLGAHVLWSWVTDTVQSSLAHQAAQRGAEIMIANREGKILYPAAYLNMALDVPSPQTDNHYETRRWPDGENYLTAQFKVTTGSTNELGWSIVVRQPEALALEPILDMRNRLLLLGTAAAALFVWVAYWLSTRIGRPIEKLTKAVRHIEKRDQAPVFPGKVSIWEFEQLNLSVQSMTRSLLEHERELNEINASLEKLVEERTAALTLSNKELERLATRDALTNVYGRRRFDEKLHELFQMFKRSGESFSILMIDADHFKRVNDTWGHHAGDEVLRQLARIVTESTRVTDFVARYGGEEFVVLLPDTEEQEGLVVGENIRRAVEAATFPEVGKMTISVGLSCSGTEDAAEGEIVQRADRALYQAKEQGRNQVIG